MAVSCAPTDLSTAAKCFQCIPGPQRQAITVYLLQQIAGLGSKTPSELSALAKCFACLTADQLRQIEVYLLCQIVNK